MTYDIMPNLISQLILIVMLAGGLLAGPHASMRNILWTQVQPIVDTIKMCRMNEWAP